MKKFLILIPLLGACAPAVGGANTNLSASVGPFKLGQTWSLAGESENDPLIPPEIVFTIQKVFSERQTVIGLVKGISDKTPVQIEYSAKDDSILVADITPISFGSKSIRLCSFDSPYKFDSPHENIQYFGLLAYLDPEKFDIAKFKNTFLKTRPDATDKEITKVFMLAQPDGGSCGLQLVK